MGFLVYSRLCGVLPKHLERTMPSQREYSLSASIGLSGTWLHNETHEAPKGYESTLNKNDTSFATKRKQLHPPPKETTELAAHILEGGAVNLAKVSVPAKTTAYYCTYLIFIDLIEVLWAVKRIQHTSD